MKRGDVVDGKYEIVRLLGEGGMGAVYEAHHKFIGRHLALKCLHADLAADPEVAERFVREARAAAAIGSDHIVEVTDGGLAADGTPYIVMELLEGEDLGELIEREGRLDVPRAIGLVLQACEALQEAHEQGIVHRDLKPQNLFVTKRKDGADWLKVLDFGIAKFRAAVSDESKGLTRTGMTLGTPYYMPREQFMGAKKVDQRADIYAAGVVLYQLLVGRLPFQGTSYEEIIVQIATATPAPLGTLRPGLSPELEAAVAKAMAREADARFPSMRHFAESLAPFAAGQTRAAVAAPPAPLAPTLPQAPRAPVGAEPPGVEAPPAGAPIPPTQAVEPPRELPATEHHAEVRQARAVQDVWLPEEDGGVEVTFEPADEPDEARPRRWRPVTIAVVAVLALALVTVGVVMLAARRDAETPTETIPAGPHVAPAPPTDEAKERARELIDREQWESALAVLRATLPNDDPEVDALVALAHSEQEAQRTLEAACGADGPTDPVVLHETCESIGEGSRYRKRDCCRDAASRAGNDRLDAAKRLLREGQEREAAEIAKALADDRSMPESIRDRARELETRAGKSSGRAEIASRSKAEGRRPTKGGSRDLDGLLDDAVGGGGSGLPPEPSRANKRAVLYRNLLVCKRMGEKGSGQITVSIQGATGKVTGCRVSGELAGTRTATCFCERIRRDRFERFSRSSVTYAWPVSLTH